MHVLSRMFIGVLVERIQRYMFIFYVMLRIVILIAVNILLPLMSILPCILLPLCNFISVSHLWCRRVNFFVCSFAKLREATA